VSRIPRVLHYTFGMAADFGGKPWSLVHHVCLTSAITHIRPERVLFYCEYEPTGAWWELSRAMITLVKIAAPREIFGMPLAHVAHRSDVVRLQKLIENGGIYLDADVLVQRDFDDLLGESTVLGREGEVGMANAVILAEPNAPFLLRWLDAYRTFRSRGRDEFWNEHSVALPARLAKQYPQDITILSDKAFFWPLWHDHHIDWIFKSNLSIPLDQTYANHLWEANAWWFLKDLTPGEVRAEDTNFNRWARPYLQDLPDNYGTSSDPYLRMLRRRVRLNRNVRHLQTLKKRINERARRIKPKLERWATHVVRLTTSNEQWRRQIFQTIYKNRLWGDDAQSKFFSGVGSRGDAVFTYVEKMSALIQRYATELGRPPVVVDLGCGDFQVGAALLSKLPDIEYIGCDIVPELITHNNKAFGADRISFRSIDIVLDPLPAGDICLVRQVFQHLSNKEISTILKRLGAYKLIYVTEGQPQHRIGPANPDKAAGADVRFDWATGRGRGVELDLPPYNASAVEVFRAFAPPHEVIVTQQVIPNALAEA
jgi:SAM-dependent methyltransferase